VNFCTFTSAKRSLVLDVVPNVNLEIRSQYMTINKVGLKENHNKIQQSHVAFCFFDMDFITNRKDGVTK
jgi:hypothetical protein